MRNGTTQIPNLFDYLQLSKNEQKVYSAALSYPPLLITQLAKICNFSRTNTYNIISLLEKKSLCSYIPTQTGKKVVLVTPNDLLEIFTKKVKETKDIEKSAAQFINDLNTKKHLSAPTETHVTYYRGYDSVIKLHMDSIINNSEGIVRGAIFHDMFNRFAKKDILEYVEARTKKGIQGKVLHPKKDYAFHEVFGSNSEHLREVRYAPETVNFDSLILIYGNRVSFITMTEDFFGTLIESKDFSTTMRSWFDTIWNISTPEI